MKRVLKLLAAAAFALLGALFTAAFYWRYWIWRDCFNELGRCYDPVSEDVFLEQAGIVWGGLAGLSLFVALILVTRLLVARRQTGV